jgi:hypothetical protein
MSGVGAEAAARGFAVARGVGDLEGLWVTFLTA